MKRWGILGSIAFASVVAQAAPATQPADSWLINGTVVDSADYPEVVQIKTKITRKDPITGETRTGIASCTASVVGPHAILTAAHCGEKGAVSKFEIDGEEYSATLSPSPDFRKPSADDPNVGLDLSIGYVKKEIRGVTPVSVGGEASVGLGLTILGYGCTKVGGGGGNDGKLRMGNTVVTQIKGADMLSQQPGGSALCSGDSGGPTYVDIDGETFQVGVHSRGNLRNRNIDLRTDLAESRAFLKATARKLGVTVCGVTKDCETISTARFRN